MEAKQGSREGRGPRVEVWVDVGKGYCSQQVYSTRYTIPGTRWESCDKLHNWYRTGTVLVFTWYKVPYLVLVRLYQ